MVDGERIIAWSYDYCGTAAVSFAVPAGRRRCLLATGSPLLCTGFALEGFHEEWGGKAMAAQLVSLPFAAFLELGSSNRDDDTDLCVCCDGKWFPLFWVVSYNCFDKISFQILFNEIFY